MTYLQKRSLIGFSVSSSVTSLLFSILFFGGTFNIVIPLVISATVFSGLFGFLLGNYFMFSGPNKKLNSMLLGGLVALLAYIPSIAFFFIAFKISFFGFNVIFSLEKYFSEFILTAGIGTIFTAPLILPIGAYTGVYVNNV